MVVELYSTEQCRLCEEARGLLVRLQSTHAFELRETRLTSDHPLYNRYALAVPVILIDGVRELRAPVSEAQLIAALTPGGAPGRKYVIGKFLEALGLVTVAFGFVYGLMGDMWTDLYFFLSGIAIFFVGWLLERTERPSRVPPAVHQAESAADVSRVSDPSGTKQP